MILLTAAIAAELQDAAAGLLHASGAAGVELRDGDTLPPPGVPPLPTGRAEVRGFFETKAEAAQAAQRLRTALRCDPSVAEVLPEDWASSWRKHFRPQHRGRIFVVAPWMSEAEHPTPRGARRLTLEPGLAFGTGDHPTTGQCLEEVGAFLQQRPGASVLDVGTGSGILAIAARMLGAGVTVGTDNDPVALRVARENAHENGVSILVEEHPPARAKFDLVLANILANTLIELAPVLAQAVAPGGRLVLSGVLGEQGDDVEAAYRPLLVPGPRRIEANWVCAVFDAVLTD